MTKDVGKGSGLGLSMVYGFAKQSNGAFRLTSDLGPWNNEPSFGFRGPLSAPLPRSEPARKEQGSPRSLRRLGSLLVDDHAEVRSAIAAHA